MIQIQNLEDKEATFLKQFYAEISDNQCYTPDVRISQIENPLCLLFTWSSGPKKSLLVIY